LKVSNNQSTIISYHDQYILIYQLYMIVISVDSNCLWPWSMYWVRIRKRIPRPMIMMH